MPRQVKRYLLFVLTVFAIGYLATINSPHQRNLSSNLTVLDHNYINNKATSNGYDWILKLIDDNNPKVTLTKYKSEEKAKEKFATDTDFIFSRDYLSSLLKVDDESFESLKRTHASFLAQLKNDNHRSFHSESKTKGPPQGNGIVFVGGVKFSWLAFIGIEQLRLLGCTLPIEVFIGNEGEYEKEFCEVILPRYNARCTVLPREINDLNKKISTKINGYQYKNLAFLVSNFENILFLDADNVPVHDPTPLFDSKVYRDTGLVIWPDAWGRTTNPLYYDIAGLKVTDKIVRGRFKSQANKFSLNLNKDVPFHDLENTLPDPTSESGMILVNKIKHSKTLMLSLYYNIYGPNLYYALFSQGSAGEGDKETFMAAATVLGKKYYQVQQPFKFIGYHYSGKFNSKALGQADPIVDFENKQRGSHLNHSNEFTLSKDSKPAPILFMHLSYPKLIPFALLHDDEIIKPDSGHIRMYLSSTEGAGYDFELRIFEIITGALCKDYKGHTPISERLIGLKLKEYWGQDPSTFCPKLIQHTEWLQANPEKLEG